MYWSVLGCIIAVEYVAEWLLCWYVCSNSYEDISRLMFY